jgi:hypothetical protein
MIEPEPILRNFTVSAAANRNLRIAAESFHFVCGFAPPYSPIFLFLR